MKILKLLTVIIGFLILFSSCNKEEIDNEKPVIDLSIQGAFPKNCDTLYFGESFTFNELFKDNSELGSYSIDIHHNFDHHSHSTEVNECILDPIKTPVNPFTLIEDYHIPEGLKEYQPMKSIYLPAENASGLYDEGDYHFFISLTDKEGWSAQKGLSIKIMHR